MQLDQTRIEIRERGLSDLFDLALHVFRSHGLALVFWLAIGVLPFALLNALLLSGELSEADFAYDSADGAIFPFGVFRTDGVWGYMWLYVLLLVWEMPAATSLATLYLGQSLFVEKPSAAGIWKSLASSAPQLILFQGIIRGILTFFLIPWIFFFAVWPHLNEVILLERNPLLRKKGRASAMGRTSSLHSRHLGELFARWLAAMTVGFILTTTLTYSIYFIRGLATFNWELDAAFLLIWWPLAVWLTVSFFTVVRFLGYLDLRIRSEGWEVELSLRAEAAALERQLA